MDSRGWDIYTQNHEQNEHVDAFVPDHHGHAPCPQPGLRVSGRSASLPAGPPLCAKTPAWPCPASAASTWLRVCAEVHGMTPPSPNAGQSDGFYLLVPFWLYIYQHPVWFGFNSRNIRLVLLVDHEGDKEMLRSRSTPARGVTLFPGVPGRLREEETRFPEGLSIPAHVR